MYLSSYRNIWWPDIIKGAKKYNIKYSGTIIENYTDNVKAPFAKNSGVDSSLLLYGRELLINGGELGIHGYNHQSLALKNYIKQSLGYNPWNSEVDMEKSILEVNRFAKTSFPNYDFRLYVPPSNILSPEGKATIKKTMPDLKIIASIYVNNEFKDAYSQEFEIKDGITELPRLTYGYSATSEIVWNTYNGLTSLGVFSHFIHPDDVLDKERNDNKTWPEMLKDYNSFLDDIYSKFHWLKPNTASEAAEAFKIYNDVQPAIDYKADSVNVYCENFVENTSFILRSKTKVLSYKECTVSKIDSDVYLVVAKKPSFSIKVSR